MEVENRLVGPIDETWNGNARHQHQLDQIVVGQSLDIRHSFGGEPRPVIEIDALQVGEREGIRQRRRDGAVLHPSPGRFFGSLGSRRRLAQPLSDSSRSLFSAACGTIPTMNANTSRLVESSTHMRSSTQARMTTATIRTLMSLYDFGRRSLRT